MSKLKTKASEVIDSCEVVDGDKLQVKFGDNRTVDVPYTDESVQAIIDEKKGVGHSDTLAQKTGSVVVVRCSGVFIGLCMAAIATAAQNGQISDTAAYIGGGLGILFILYGLLQKKKEKSKALTKTKPDEE